MCVAPCILLPAQRNIYPTPRVRPNVIRNLERKLSNSNVVLEIGMPLFHTTAPGDTTSKHALSDSGSIFKQLRHIYAVLLHTYSFFFMDSLIYSNVPLGMVTNI